MLYFLPNYEKVASEHGYSRVSNNYKAYIFVNITQKTNLGNF